MDNSQRQLENYVSFFIFIEEITKIIENDSNQSIDLDLLLPLIQDAIIQSYSKLKNSQLQEQILVNTVLMAKVIASYQKNKSNNIV